MTYLNYVCEEVQNVVNEHSFKFNALKNKLIERIEDDKKMIAKIEEEHNEFVDRVQSMLDGLVDSYDNDILIDSMPWYKRFIETLRRL